VTAQAALAGFWRDRSLESAVYDKGELLKERLNAIAGDIGTDRVTTRGRGMMRGLAMPSGEIAGKVIATAFERGLVIETCGPHDEVVKCLPALTISEDELVQGTNILADAVQSVFVAADRAAA
jgi:diaminobutyrate-2-oxoglutarate transaminase